MDINIREAKKNDDSFLAWVMLAATRLHLPFGIWDHYVNRTEQYCLSFLKLVATTQKPHLFHYSTFMIAEIDGQSAGALSGYDPEVLGFEAFAGASPEIFQKVGWSKDEQKPGFKRYLSWLSCVPENTKGAWIVESVAALPEHRKKGVVSRLLDEILEKGRKGGYKIAQIGYLINIHRQSKRMKKPALNMSEKKETRVLKKFSAHLE